VKEFTAAHDMTRIIPFFHEMKAGMAKKTKKFWIFFYLIVNILSANKKKV